MESALKHVAPAVPNPSPWSLGASLFLNLQDAFGYQQTVSRLPGTPAGSTNCFEGGAGGRLACLGWLSLAR